MLERGRQPQIQDSGLLDSRRTLPGVHAGCLDSAPGDRSTYQGSMTRGTRIPWISQDQRLWCPVDLCLDPHWVWELSAEWPSPSTAYRGSSRGPHCGHPFPPQHLQDPETALYPAGISPSGEPRSRGPQVGPSTWDPKKEVEW